MFKFNLLYNCSSGSSDTNKYYLIYYIYFLNGLIFF